MKPIFALRFRRSRKANRPNSSLACRSRTAKSLSAGTGKQIALPRGTLKINDLFDSNGSLLNACRDSSVVKASKDIMISFNGLDMKLTITTTSTSHSGTYKVVVSNEYGQDESSARLVVEVRYEYLNDDRTCTVLISLRVRPMLHPMFVELSIKV